MRRQIEKTPGTFSLSGEVACRVYRPGCGFLPEINLICTNLTYGICLACIIITYGEILMKEPVTVLIRPKERGGQR